MRPTESDYQHSCSTQPNTRLCVQAQPRSPVQLCDPLDCSPSGSSVHGVLQARILEWVAIPFSRDIPDSGIKVAYPVSPALQTDSLPAEPSGKPELKPK